MYFNHDQELVLKTILEGLTVNKKPRMLLADLVSEYKLLDAFTISPYTEAVKADILSVAENENIELTEEQLDQLIVKMKNYDHCEYKEYISSCIADLFKPTATIV